MPFFGDPEPGDQWTAVASGGLRVMRFSHPGGRVGFLSAYLDGQGGGTAQVVRPAVYAAPYGALLDVGPEVVIEPGRAAGWVELPLDAIPALTAIDVEVGLHFGAGDAARMSYSASAAGTPSASHSSAYAAGAPSPFPAGYTPTARDYAIWGHFHTASGLPAGETDDFYGRLGWGSSQEVFGSTGIKPGTVKRVTCGWHGERFHPAVGAFAVVATDGPLAEWVGERVKVSSGGRSVLVYVTDERDVAEDLSLARQAFARLAPLSTEELVVDAEMMG